MGIKLRNADPNVEPMLWAIRIAPMMYRQRMPKEYCKQACQLRKCGSSKGWVKILGAD
jgi:hypothetical protein